MTVPAQDSGIEVGIIGMGDMGRLYASKLVAAGWKVNVCDRPERYEALTEEYKGKPPEPSTSACLERKSL